MTKYVHLFERVVTVALAVMMMIVVLLAVLELGWIVVKDVVSPPVVFLEIDELIEIFGAFFLVLIGVELLETIKAYISEGVVRVEVVVLVAMIALARKVIVFDSAKDGSPITLIGIAAALLALAVAHRLVKRAPTPPAH
jgi:uncharacterized membrane protein (DUF373 family)